MQIAKSFALKPSAATVLLMMVGALSSPMQGQQSPAVHVGNAKITGLADDWTHHHLVFSNPGTQEDAIKNGTYDQWSKVVTEPRYVVQQLKKGLPAQGLRAPGYPPSRALFLAWILDQKRIDARTAALACVVPSFDISVRK